MFDGNEPGACGVRTWRSTIARNDNVIASAERRQPGFGAIRAVRHPLPMCKAEIEQTYASRSEEPGCVNPEFGELPVGEPTFRVFAQIKSSS